MQVEDHQTNLHSVFYIELYYQFQIVGDPKPVISIYVTLYRKLAIEIYTHAQTHS